MTFLYIDNLLKPSVIRSSFITLICVTSCRADCSFIRFYFFMLLSHNNNKMRDAYN